jgi:hypothetical protein
MVVELGVRSVTRYDISRQNEPESILDVSRLGLCMLVVKYGLRLVGAEDWLKFYVPTCRNA